MTTLNSYEQPPNYDWTIRTYLVDQKEDEKKGINKLIRKWLYLFYEWSANLFIYKLSSRLSIGQLNTP